MTSQDVRSLITDERESLLDGKTGIEEAVVTRPRRGQTVAVGLLALDEVESAFKWFRALTDEWPLYAANRWDGSYETKPRQSAQRGPWEDYINALYSAILGQHQIKDVAKEAYQRATAEFIDALENRNLAHRVDLVRALSGFLLGTGTVEDHLQDLEQNVRERDKSWAVDRYLPYMRVLRGLHSESESEVAAGIDGLLEFHRDRVVDAPDADAVQKAVALDATAMLALARREGLDITVDHDAIPDAVNDDECYPVSE